MKLNPAIISNVADVFGLVFLCMIFAWLMRDYLNAMLGSKLLSVELNCRLHTPQTFPIRVEHKKPRWIILYFPRGVGFYNGEITVKNGNDQVGSIRLPVIEQFANKSLHIYNTVITRSKRVATIRISACTLQLPLSLTIHLNSNVLDSELVDQLKIAQEISIHATIRG